MIIDTEKVDTRKVAIEMLRAGGMDWIDKPAEELWPDDARYTVAPDGSKRDREDWRQALIGSKQQEVEDFMRRMTAALESVTSA